MNVIFNKFQYNSFINIFDNSLVDFSNLDINYFESKTIKELVNYESENLHYRDGGKA